MSLEQQGGKEVEVEAKEIKELPKPPDADELMKQADDLGEQLRALIVLAKKLPRDASLEAHQDPMRALAVAQVNLQTGFAWLRKAIKAPREF